MNYAKYLVFADPDWDYAGYDFSIVGAIRLLCLGIHGRHGSGPERLCR